MPSGIGYFIYHRLQKNSIKHLKAKIKSNKANLSLYKKIFTQHNISLINKDIIEIGSGWFPIFPFLFKSEFKVNKVSTYDINEHYNNKRVIAAKKLLYNIDQGKHSSKYGLPKFVEYHPKTNFINAKLNKNAKLVFSRFVLEHVKPEDIYLMHKKIHQDLEDEVIVFHHISPSDHRAYSDNSISYYDFLKYSKTEWNNIQTKFDYHNRLRLPQYLEIFEKAGFKVKFLNHDHVSKDSIKYKKFKSLKLHDDYTNFTEEEILAGSISVLLEKR